MPSPEDRQEASKRHWGQKSWTCAACTLKESLIKRHKHMPSQTKFKGLASLPSRDAV